MVISTSPAPEDSAKADEPGSIAKLPQPGSPAEPPQGGRLTAEQLLRMQANREQGAPVPFPALPSYVHFGYRFLSLPVAIFDGRAY